MKKFTAVFILLVAGVTACAAWFCPFSQKGAYVYQNNIAVERVDGLCYHTDACVRYDATGDESALIRELDSIGATPVETEQEGDVIFFYALSDRVCAPVQKTASGKSYNVMAALRDGHIAIGAPVLCGSY